jgi:hypothetical protein
MARPARAALRAACTAQASHRDRQASGKLVAAVRVMSGVKGNLSYFQQLIEAAQEEEEDERTGVAQDAFFAGRRAPGRGGLGLPIAPALQDPFDVFAGHLSLMRANSARFTTEETRSKFASLPVGPPGAYQRVMVTMCMPHAAAELASQLHCSVARTNCFRAHLV